MANSNRRNSSIELLSFNGSVSSNQPAIRDHIVQFYNSDVGQNLLIFSVKMKNKKMSKIILEQRHLNRNLHVSDNGSTKGKT
jgi:hypothetical protein